MNYQKKLILVSLTVVCIALIVIGPLYIAREINGDLRNDTTTVDELGDSGNSSSAEIGLLVVESSADNSDMDSHSIEDASESNFIEALKTGSKSVAALANISRTHNENEESNAIEISSAESTSLAPEESTSTSPVEPDFEGGLSLAQTLIDILHGSRKRRDVSHDEQYAEIPNKLIGKNVRIPGALLPFSKTPVSNLSKAELQKLVGRYKKTGPVTPAFIDDNADPVDGDQLNNPLKEK